MFNWFRRRKYREEALGAMLASMGRIFDDDKEILLQGYPGIEQTISNGFSKGRDHDELGLEIAAILLIDVIEKNPDQEWRERSLSQINERIAHPNWHHSLVRKQTAQGTYLKGIDDFVWQLEWFIGWTIKYSEDNPEASESCRIYILDLIGALENKSREDRRAERIEQAILEFMSRDSGPL